MLLTPDGSKVFATAVTGLPDDPRAEVAEFSAQAGQLLRVVSPCADESGIGTSWLALWSDPSGDQLTSEYGQVGWEQAGGTSPRLSCTCPRTTSRRAARRSSRG